MSEESDKDLDKAYQKAIEQQDNSVKLNFALQRLRSLEDRMDNGISETVHRNSWAVGVYGAIITGLAIASLAGLI